MVRTLALVTLVATLLSVGVPAAAALGLVLWCVAHERRRRVAASRDDAADRAALAAIEAVALEMRCGASPSVAVAAAVTAAEEICAAPWVARLARVGHGADPDREVDLDGAEAVIRRVADVEVPASGRALAAAFALSAQTGAGLADLCDRLGEAVRAEQRSAAELRDALVGARSSGDLLTGLPVVGVLLSTAMGAHPGHILLHTPAGSACLLVGVALACCGRLWTGRLVERARAAGR